jgi:NitT/TauT family transport system substrate-binding protein
MRSTIIATMLKSRVYGIIAAPGIRSVSELKGAAIYGSDPGSAPYTFTSAILREAGLDPAKDVSFLQMNTDAAIMALEKGEIKAAFINMFKVPELKGIEVNILVDTTREADRLKYLGTTEFPAEMLCVTEKYARENPEICQKVIDAVMDAQKWIRSTVESRSPPRYSVFTALDPETLAQEVAVCVTCSSPTASYPRRSSRRVRMCLDTGLSRRPSLTTRS